jgi:hypothetical protein
MTDKNKSHNFLKIFKTVTITLIIHILTYTKPRQQIYYEQKAHYHFYQVKLCCQGLIKVSIQMQVSTTIKAIPY